MANPPFSELNGGTEGIASNIWKMLPLIVLYPVAVLFIQAQAGWGKGKRFFF